MGRLSGKLCHNSSTLNTTYGYNIRGWVTAIEDSKFTQMIGYNEPGGYYNGNIRSMAWKIGSESFTRKYTYTYDGLDRLTNAAYTQSNGQSGNYTAIIAITRWAASPP